MSALSHKQPIIINPEAKETGFRILCLESDPSAAHILEKYLTNQGHSVYTAYTAHAAIEVLEQLGAIWGLLIVDIDNGEGIEVIKYYRTKWPSSRTVLAVTSHTSIKALSDFGAHAFIQRPYSMAGLASVLHMMETKNYTTTPVMTSEKALPHILIIDDLRANRLSLKIMLGGNYKVTQAASAEEGIAKFNADTFDLILVDYQMPNVDGLGFLAQLRVIDPSVAVAMVTAHASLESAIKAMKLEAFDYLQKPYTEEKLAEVVTKGIQLTTERRESAKRIRLGQAAHEFIHDLSSPLSVVTCMASLLKEEGLGNQPKEAIQEGAERCHNLMHLWHEQARSTGYFKNWYSPGVLLSSMEKQVQPLLKGVRCVLNPLPQTHEVHVDKTQFLRVVENLINNSVYAVYHSPGGLAGGIQINTKLENDSFIFEIQDTGNGMDEATLAKIATPYFTTKGTEGTGLGLAICMRIVKEMGGTLTFSSELGKGTKALLTFPAREIKSK